MRTYQRVLFGVSVPVLIVAVLVASWAIDTARSKDAVPRNVDLAGTPIGGSDHDDLEDVVAELADRYEGLAVQLRTNDGDRHDLIAADLGLRVDRAATVRAAIDIDDGESLATRPLKWLGSFAEPRAAKVRFAVDAEVLEATVDELAGNAAAAEPEIITGAEGLAILSGKEGRRIDPAGLRAQLLAEIDSGDDPIVLDAQISTAPPGTPDAVAQDFANRINAVTANGLRVTGGSHEVVIRADTVRSWLGGAVDGGEVSLTVDEDAAKAAIEEAMPTEAEAKDASITLVEGTPTVTPSEPGEKCCGPDTGAKVRAAIEAGENAIEVDLEIAEPKFSTEDAEALGVKEPVGSVTEWAGRPQVKSFTTYYSPGQSRVINIQKIADDVRGVLVKPGEQFSINGIVGPRTREKGYVAAGAIANGKHVDEVGGGVSQFATTMFNAVYYAGLQVDTSQAHSEWFSRYPRGREATMGHPAPDLAWTNNSPYGILVWTSYTDTSITVTLYSTQWASAEQTGSRESRSGNCTVVTTTRTITYADGRTANDEFSARYRDSGSTTC